MKRVGQWILPALLLLAGSVSVGGQGLLAPLPILQFFDNSGVMLTGGKLCTYASGTTTPQATYSDAVLSVPNSNPIILTASGRFANNVYLSPLSYKFVLLTAGTDSTCSTGTMLWTADQVPGGYSASTILVAGTVPTARLGSGSATSATFLRGDSTWATAATGPLWTTVTTTAVGTQNNFNPGLSGNTHIVCNNASLLTITGFPAGFDRQLILLTPLNAQVDFPFNSASSSVGNRLINWISSAPTSLSGSSTGSILYVYNLSTARWELVSHFQGDFISYTPTFTTSAGATWTAVTISASRYLLVNRKLTIIFEYTASTVSATNAVELRFTLPSTMTSVGRANTLARIVDNGGGGTTGSVVLSAADTFVRVYRDTLETSNWTASATNTSVRGTVEINVN